MSETSTPDDSQAPSRASTLGAPKPDCASRHLQVSYIVGLSLVAILAVGSHLLLASMLAASARNSVDINLAGRQRMLSQRIVTEAIMATSELGDGTEISQLEADLVQFDEAHELLRSTQESSIHSATLKTVFDAIDEPHKSLATVARRVAEELKRDGGPQAGSIEQLIAEQASFLPLMEQLVEVYQSAADAKLDRGSKLHFLAGAILLLVIVLDVVFLFRPSILRIRRQMLELAIAQERSQLLATAAEHTRHAVLLGEADGSIVWTNPAAATRFQHCESIIPTLADATPQEVAEEVRSAIAAGSDLHLESVSHGEASSSVDLVAVRDEDGSARRYVLVVTDLSARARRERDLQGVQRRAGRADVAASVLHNVGNTLNSLALAAGSADAQLRESRLPGLGRAIDLLDHGEGDSPAPSSSDPRVPKLPEYLRRLYEHLEGEHERVRSDLRSVQAGVDHLQQFISRENESARQTATDLDAAIETVETAALVTEAARVYGNAATCEGIELDISEAQAPLPLLVDRHEVLQILGNLITNAVYSVTELRKAEGSAPPIRVVSGRCGGNCGFIEVVDRGLGIAPDDLALLFSAGFSTKPGSDGIGLNASAHAATAMGGQLTAYSEGPGKGATFRLELRLQPVDAPTGLGRKFAA